MHAHVEEEKEAMLQHRVINSGNSLQVNGRLRFIEDHNIVWLVVTN